MKSHEDDSQQEAPEAIQPKPPLDKISPPKINESGIDGISSIIPTQERPQENDLESLVILENNINDLPSECSNTQII